MPSLLPAAFNGILRADLPVEEIAHRRCSMRAIWKGTISFGLVNIPISIYPATRREEISFRLLRDSDLSPVNYKRVAESDGKEVPWDHIVKGYEYEKDQYVSLTPEDFKRVAVEGTQTIDIMNFIKIEEVNPLLFYKPYYLESGKGADKAYSLLRDALVASGKIAIATVVLKSRQHLAAIKPQGKGLMLELMHFPNEVLDETAFKLPEGATASKPEMKMALQLIDSMSSKWNPEDYKDQYREALESMITRKLENAAEPVATPRKKSATNVIDLASVLQRSIQETSHPRKRKGSRKGAA
jgi:DNA end-binding protein Ku